MASTSSNTLAWQELCVWSSRITVWANINAEVFICALLEALQLSEGLLGVMRYT